jgi:hypothetical protein
MVSARVVTLAVVALAAHGRAEQVGIDAAGQRAAYDLGTSSVEEVASWLDDISFGDLKKAFAKNAVDGPALRDITEDELKDLGVKKVG